MDQQTGQRRYRIDFALMVLTGNLTRYLQLRPFVEADHTVRARWYPIRTWVDGDVLGVFPKPIRIRLRQTADSWRLYLRRPPDAIVMHAFETYYLYALWLRLRRARTVLVHNGDGSVDGPHPSRRPLTRWLRRQAVCRTDLFVPWSTPTAAKTRAQHPEIPAERLWVLHPGIDLARWPLRAPPAPAPRFRILFVAGNLVLKGAETVLDAFERRLQGSCELWIATQSMYLPPGLRRRIEQLPRTQLHLDLQPRSPELQRLYRSCDVFVLPTTSDTSSWVALEALATGVPVVISPQGGIPEIVRHEETGLHIPPRDPEALADAVERLRLDDALRARLVAQGRAHVEEHYDAAKNTARLLDAVKGMVRAG